jgi:hypothetical protein
MKSNINLNSSRLNMSRAEAGNNDRMQRLGEKLSKITVRNHKNLLNFRLLWKLRKAINTRRTNKKF